MKRTKEDLINYRIQRAHESLGEAKVLANSSYWNATSNRLYYSCFYMVNALFAMHEILSKSHSGIKAEFHKSFIKTGIFDRSLGKIYSELFDNRQEGDYHDFYFFEKEEVEPKIDLVEQFINEIERYIRD